MNIFWREVKAYRNSTIIWTLTLSLLLITFLSMFPSFSNDVEATKKILQNLPPFMASAAGISPDILFSIYGFMSWLLTFITLAGAVQAMNLGVGVLSKEESGKTADFLLTKPVSRTKVITGKLLAVIFLVLVTNVVFLVTAFAMAVAVTETDFNIGTLFLVSAKLVLIQMMFLVFGFLLAVIAKKIKSSIAVSLPAVFSLFIVGTLGAVLEIDSVKYISPFKFFDSDYIITNNSYDIKFLIIEAVFVVIAIILSYIIYIKKDIKAAS
ncbi:MAG: ABC transporter permease subunit [Candidatus Saccharimonadales bacterium]